MCNTLAVLNSYFIFHDVLKVHPCNQITWQFICFYAWIICSLYATFYLFILPAWAYVSIIWLLRIMLLATSTYKSLPRHVLPIFLGTYLGMELLDFVLTRFLKYCITLIMIYKVDAPPYHATNNGLISPHPFQLLQYANIWYTLVVRNYEFHGKDTKISLWISWPVSSEWPMQVFFIENLYMK